MQRSCEPRMTVASRTGCQQDHHRTRRPSTLLCTVPSAWPLPAG